jgi:FkbM family methyltransferase
VEDALVLAMPGLVRLLRQRGRDLVATRSAAHWCEFEDPLPLAVVALLDLVDGCFYDVGANTGFYSVLVGRLRPDVVVRAFEPVPEIAEHLVLNMSVNGLSIVPEQVALSDRDGSAQLHFPPDVHGLIESSASLNPSFKEEVVAAIDVRCERLDSAQSRLGDERVGFVKIDVEGAEELVLAGAGDCLRRDRPFVAVELLPRARFDVVAGVMADHGYRLLSMRPGLEVAEETEPHYIEESWNQLLVPAERFDDVVARLTAAAGAIAVDRDTLTSRERLLFDSAIVERRAGQAELDDLAGLLADTERILREQIAVLEVQLQDARSERDAATDALRPAQEQVESLRRELAEERARADQEQARADDAELRTRELTESTSWRVTAPLRRVSSATSRGKR